MEIFRGVYGSAALSNSSINLIFTNLLSFCTNLLIL